MSTPSAVRAVPPGYEGGDFLTLSAVAVRLGQPEHLVRRAARMGLVPMGRAGRIGLVRPADLPLIRSNMADAGLLTAVDPATLPPGMVM